MYKFDRMEKNNELRIKFQYESLVGALRDLNDTARSQHVLYVKM